MEWTGHHINNTENEAKTLINTTKEFRVITKLCYLSNAVGYHAASSYKVLFTKSGPNIYKPIKFNFINVLM